MRSIILSTCTFKTAFKLIDTLIIDYHRNVCTLLHKRNFDFNISCSKCNLKHIMVIVSLFAFLYALILSPISFSSKIILYSHLWSFYIGGYQITSLKWLSGLKCSTGIQFLIGMQFLASGTCSETAFL